MNNNQIQIYGAAMTDKPQAGPSKWQEKITGDWHGIPSVFEPDGTHVGLGVASQA